MTEDAMIQRLLKQREGNVKLREAQRKHKDQTGFKSLGYYLGRIDQIDIMLRDLGHVPPLDPGQEWN